MEEAEYYFKCPYCSDEISMLIDLSISGQTYIEDCETCCRPIAISYQIEDNQISEFQGEALED